MKNLIILIIILGTTTPCLSQQITNTDFQTKDKQIIVTYDLTGTEAQQLFKVSLFVSTDEGRTWKGPLRKVTGAVGSIKEGGTEKAIIWDALQEIPVLIGMIGFRVEVEILDRTLPEMIFVKGSTFQMGSNQGESNEKPLHGVTIHDFHISKYEITNEQYCKFLNERGNEIDGKVTWIDLKDEDCKIEEDKNKFTVKPKYSDTFILCLKRSYFFIIRFYKNVNIAKLHEHFLKKYNEKRASF
jgi:hypothetical protein